jgi:hypothetical protein
MGRFKAGPPTLDAYLGRSYYTTEPEANLYYTVLRSDREIVRLRIVSQNCCCRSDSLSKRAPK